MTTSNKKILEYNLTDASLISETGLDLRASSITPGSIGAGALKSLTNITVSNNVDNLSGLRAPVAEIDFDSVTTFLDNITRMNAIIDSKTNRLMSEFGRLNDEKAALLKPKEFIDTKLVKDRSVNPYDLSVISADPYKAITLMP